MERDRRLLVLAGVAALGLAAWRGRHVFNTVLAPSQAGRAIPPVSNKPVAEAPSSRLSRSTEWRRPAITKLLDGFITGVLPDLSDLSDADLEDAINEFTSNWSAVPEKRAVFFYEMALMNLGRRNPKEALLVLDRLSRDLPQPESGALWSRVAALYLNNDPLPEPAATTEWMQAHRDLLQKVIVGIHGDRGVSLYEEVGLSQATKLVESDFPEALRLAEAFELPKDRWYRHLAEAATSPETWTAILTNFPPTGTAPEVQDLRRDIARSAAFFLEREPSDTALSELASTPFTPEEVEICLSEIDPAKMDNPGAWTSWTEAHLSPEAVIRVKECWDKTRRDHDAEKSSDEDPGN